jgi:hypothetical protein
MYTENGSKLEQREAMNLVWAIIKKAHSIIGMSLLAFHNSISYSLLSFSAGLAVAALRA